MFTVSVSVMFGMNRYKILKCFIKEKRNCRRAFLSGDRSYSMSVWVLTHLRQISALEIQISILEILISCFKNKIEISAF